MQKVRAFAVCWQSAVICVGILVLSMFLALDLHRQIGRASCRERVSPPVLLSGAAGSVTITHV